ncbi:hypothetical protein [uncultured Rikenella sp.]|uniref:hypothetical protein n=1 Tax=uncultured Rikenella sp. TaxID=368003 RepID=UPI002612C38D|nr:hypothetical protein [uncultured Rikenella sp.]
MKRRSIIKGPGVPTAAPAGTVKATPDPLSYVLKDNAELSVIRLACCVVLGGRRQRDPVPYEVRTSDLCASVDWELGPEGTRWAPVITAVYQRDGTPRPDLIEAVQVTMADRWPLGITRRQRRR